jgi:hypothetical protein
MHDCDDVVFLAVLSSKIIIEDSCMDLCYTLSFRPFITFLHFDYSKELSNTKEYGVMYPKGYHAMSDGRKDP